MSNSYRIAGIGEVLWDVFPEGEEFGGAPANFSCHASGLGAEVCMVSSVGADERGARALAFLGRQGVDVEHVAQVDGRPTGVVQVSLSAEGKPTYEIVQPVAWDQIPWTDGMAGVAGKLDAVCFGTLGQRSPVSRETIQRFVAATRPECLRVFDINIRQDFYSRDLILASLELANVLKLNDEELPLLAGMLDIPGAPEEQLAGLVERCGLRLAVLTCGGEGALMMTPSERDFAVPTQVEVVSSVGAGDSFTAAMIMGYLRGKPLPAINQAANVLAAYVCTQRGAVPTLPEAVRAQVMG